MSTADLSELICPECDRPCDDHASDCPIPEREGTGSEPRRTKIKSMLDNTILDWNKPSQLTTINAKRNYEALIPAIEKLLAEVGSGHDEQTEDLDVDLLRSAAQVLNDNYLAGSQGARWDELEESEQEHWITAVQAVLVAAFGSSVSGGEHE
jgi:hypothetical protein